LSLNKETNIKIMKKLFFLALPLLLFLQNCDPDGNGDLCLKGDGVVNDYPLDLDSFDKISLIGPMNLKIKQGATQDVLLKAESPMFPHISYDVNGGRLIIGFKDDIRCFDTDFGVWVNITVPDVEEITVTGASEIESDGLLALDKINLLITGAAEIELSGTVEEQTIDVAGVLELSNFDFESFITDIVVTGACEAEVNVESKLNINVSGAATIRYKGTPQIQQQGAGAITLIDAN
jgi:hypothetical protein